MKLSIVIPCSDDVRIKQCIDSIDENVEIIAALNQPSIQVQRIIKSIKSKKIKVVEIETKSLPRALNAGINAANNDKVILIDSDCVFEKGAIKQINEDLDNSLIVKGKVIFQFNDFQSKIVSRAREYVYTYPPKPYNPFLAVRKELSGKVGGYIFDGDIYWTEDADLQVRLEENEVTVKYNFDAIAYHPPLSMRRDLLSAFRYGIGKRIRVEKGTTLGLGTSFQYIPDTIEKMGLAVGLYCIIWNFSYIFGYFYQIAIDPYKTRE